MKKLFLLILIIGTASTISGLQTFTLGSASSAKTAGQGHYNQANGLDECNNWCNTQTFTIQKKSNKTSADLITDCQSGCETAHTFATESN